MAQQPTRQSLSIYQLIFLAGFCGASLSSMAQRSVATTAQLTVCMFAFFASRVVARWLSRKLDLLVSVILLAILLVIAFRVDRDLRVCWLFLSAGYSGQVLERWIHFLADRSDCTGTGAEG